MPIYQTNVFVCDKCSRTASITAEVSVYSDPVIVPPDGWGVNDRGMLLCPSCHTERESAKIENSQN